MNPKVDELLQKFKSQPLDYYIRILSAQKILGQLLPDLKGVLRRDRENNLDVLKPANAAMALVLRGSLDDNEIENKVPSFEFLKDYIEKMSF